MKKKFSNTVKIISELGKVRITFFVSISTALGYVLSGSNYDLNLLPVMFGVFLLSAGASAFNQWQEYEPDAKMNRTKKRPIPTGKVSPRFGFITASILSLSGMALLSLTGSMIVILLGVFALVWYNLVYTPLKMKTAFAIIPGSLVGSIPPAIGWVAGGGYLADPEIWALALFFFIWQIPHFWLLLMAYEEDYKKAGYPVLTEIFSFAQLRRITYLWIAVLVATCMMIPLFSAGSHNSITDILLFAAGAVLLWRARNLVRLYYETKSLKFVFIDINVYVLAVSILLSADRFILF